MLQKRFILAPPFVRLRSWRKSIYHKAIWRAIFLESILDKNGSVSNLNIVIFLLDSSIFRSFVSQGKMANQKTLQWLSMSFIVFR